MKTVRHARGRIGMLIAAALLLSACASGDHAQGTDDETSDVLYWQSPMDPSFVSKSPGKDAMGM